MTPSKKLIDIKYQAYLKIVDMPHICSITWEKWRKQRFILYQSKNFCLRLEPCPFTSEDRLYLETKSPVDMGLEFLAELEELKKEMEKINNPK